MAASPIFKVLRGREYVASTKSPLLALAVTMATRAKHPPYGVRWTITRGYRGQVIYDSDVDGIVVNSDTLRGTCALVEARLISLVTLVGEG